MRSDIEVADFERSLGATLAAKCECEAESQPASAFGIDGSMCKCRVTYGIESRAYDGCVPRDFWYSSTKQVVENVEVFNDIVVPYSQRLNRAAFNGYGLFLEGMNGSGKTLFLSWILMEVIRRRPYSVYYTTMPQLSHNTKMGFNDKKRAAKLEGYLKRDFLVIDELGKERFKDGDSYDRTVFEQWLRWRFDNSMPTLLASNASKTDLSKEPKDGGYGNSLASMIDGKMQWARLHPCDYRKNLGLKMEKEMGYDD